MEQLQGKPTDLTFGFCVNIKQSDIKYQWGVRKYKDKSHLFDGNFCEFENALSSAIKINRVSNYLIVFSVVLGIFLAFLFIFLLIGVFLKFYAYYLCDTCIQYEMDDECKKRYQESIQSILQLKKCKQIWQIVRSEKAIKKVNGGAERMVGRVFTKISLDMPFYLKTTMKFPNIKLKQERLFFLPDRILIVQKDKVKSVDYRDVNIEIGSSYFVETSIVPADAQIVGHTWQFVNKDGSPDNRYKNNRQIPRCKYGKIVLTSPELNVELQCSNFEITNSIHIQQFN